MTGDRLREYSNRGYISWMQLCAGEMWAGDWKVSQCGMKHRSMTREPQRRSNGDGFDMGGIAALRFQKAARFLGPGLYPIAKGVCIEDKPAREFTQARDERDEAAMPILRLALDLLIRFYDPDAPDAKHDGGKSGSVGTDWLDWTEDQRPAEVVAVKRNTPPQAFIACYKCGRTWAYGQPLPECGKAGCRAPGSMILSWG